MKKILIFGNSGSGKSTLSKKYSDAKNLAHLDLDTIAWLPSTPPQRKPLADSKIEIDTFISTHKGWVIEGCYTDLLELASPSATDIVFMNLPIEDCIDNAKRRPWEPHKYPSKAAQDANLNMLVEWISQYTNRSDGFSQSAHQGLFETFSKSKFMISNNSEASAWLNAQLL
ncbi:shikimate kinase [Paraglaciecola sp. 2405UD69-4]|uniref:shikimate kinase n=1 Tax=Paraglaciecola sp. 2405UD69-4 TaxID=3391836 RepID=UPI0039C8C372